MELDRKGERPETSAARAVTAQSRLKDTAATPKIRMNFS